MNQENKNNPGVVGVNNTSNVTPSNQVVSNLGESQMLAGSPGIRIAPVQEMPVDASYDNKGQVNNSVSFHNTNATVTSKAPVINPSTVVPRVEVTSALSSPPPPPVEEVVENTVVEPPKKRKGHGFLIFLLLLIIAGLGGYIYMDYQKDLARGECSPLVESDGSLRELDVNSTIVQELYEKVKTNIREDIAYHNFDDNFKLFHIRDKKELNFDYHHHDFNKIIILISGNAKYFVEGKIYDLKPWDILFINHNEIHKPIVDPDVFYERIVIWVKPKKKNKNSYFVVHS